jgi:uncharacterized protein (DUF427 family)
MLSQVDRPTRIEPGPGQESVWDYPRPPRVEPCAAHLVVELGGAVVAETTHGWRVLETSTPPTFYFPPPDVVVAHLTPTPTRTFCEWKGEASYLTVTVGDRVAVDAAWTYHTPSTAYSVIADHVAFYPQLMDACFVDGERVQAGDGSFYGGWITSSVVGPFKGAPGTLDW